VAGAGALASYDQLWEGFRQRQGKQEGTRAMIEVVQLGSKHGYDRLQRAVEKALEMGCFDVSAVRLLLESASSAARTPAEAVEIGGLRAYDRPQPNLRSYDELLRAWQPAKGVVQ